MLKTKRHMTLSSLALGVVCLAGVGSSFAAPPLKTTGAISGTVQNASGTPQLGAAVQLYNRQDRPIQRVLTDVNGRFQFAGLLPDHYSIRVTMAAFYPAIEKDIMVQPGAQSLMAVHLSSFFSTIQLSYPPLENGNLLTDDWKWVLRTATSTRPVMRFDDPADKVSLFSDTRGMLKVSASEGGVNTPVANQADL